jgi:hypothetical protein
MANDDDKPVTKAELSEAMKQVSAWISMTEKKLLEAIKRVEDDVAAHRTESS